MSYAAEAPALYYSIPDNERISRVELSSDQCIIDDQAFFVRGCLEIPVHDSTDPFVWGVWVSLSKNSFARTQELWTQEGREQEPPYFGWLSTELPIYPGTINLRTLVHTRPLGSRPFIELEPTEHPLSIEQRQGIALGRVQEIDTLIRHQ